MGEGRLHLKLYHPKPKTFLSSLIHCALLVYGVHCSFADMQIFKSAKNYHYLLTGGELGLKINSKSL